MKPDPEPVMIGYGKPRLVCPECGAQGGSEPNLIETAASKRDRGHGVRWGYVCSRCHFEIPAHLAERWGRISADETAKEWRQVYRPLAERHLPETREAMLEQVAPE